MTGCHLEGRGPRAAARSVPPEGLRKLLRWKITKTKRGLAGAAPPPVAAAQLAAPPPTVPVPPSLLPSFQAGCFFNRAATPPPDGRAGGRRASSLKAYLRSHLCLFFRPRSPTAPPTRPSGSSPAPGAGPAPTNSSSLGSPRSPFSFGCLCCPLERGPFSMGP